MIPLRVKVNVTAPATNTRSHTLVSAIFRAIKPDGKTKQQTIHKQQATTATLSIWQKCICHLLCAQEAPDVVCNKFFELIHRIMTSFIPRQTIIFDQKTHTYFWIRIRYFGMTVMRRFSSYGSTAAVSKLAGNKLALLNYWYTL